ncbi:hypothetical protein ACJ41O_008274 [Fusarium nematophilum]
MEQEDATRRFATAMHVVYGNFDSVSDDDAEKWTPPDNPGAGGHRGRYLWTDAFGVVNFITLYEKISTPKYLVLAKRLVRTVHDVLGRTRDGAMRLPGATDEEPLKGGLRIGKMDAAGSDGDGQYHHYLTLWMFALNRLSWAAADPSFNDLAIQLARSIHPRFVSRSSSSDRPRMVWKISVDARKVLVPSEGHLDAATGFAVYRMLQEISDYEQVMGRKGAMSPSGDPLDLGMGLWICHFYQDEEWAATFSEEALDLANLILGGDSSEMSGRASRRLAFREFGACLGIQCFGVEEDLKFGVEAVLKFWEEHLQQHDEDGLRPISQVMYAAALIPGGKSFCSFSQRMGNHLLTVDSVPQRFHN